MEFNEFNEKLTELMSQINVKIDDNKAQKFYDYMNMLIEWNNNINLTAITNPEDIILKHFVDSLTIDSLIEAKSEVIDVGTGAGFPGIPLSIVKEDAKLVLLDSLNKRIKFLDEVCGKIQLKNVQTMHGRAEEVANNVTYREKFDYATSRAVAPLNVLLEYLMPFVKVGGYCVCMKGSDIDEELKSANKAIKTLGGELYKVHKLQLPSSDMLRNIIVIKKVKNTPNVYPRKAGTPSKKPIL